MKKLAISISIILICYSSHQAQNIIGEIPFQNKMTDADGIVLGDSIFLNLRAKKDVSKNYWVGLNGNVSEVDLPAMAKKTLFAVAKNSFGITYYYIIWKPSAILKGIWFDAASNTYNELTEEIPLHSQRLGIYSEGGHLFILQINGSNNLALTTIQGMKIVSEKEFKIPIDFKPYQNQRTQFYNKGMEPSILNITDPIKIYREENSFWITIDQCCAPNYQSGSANKTIVVRIDGANPETPEMKVFYANTVSEFRSTLKDGVIYRTYNDKKQTTIEAYDFAAGKLLWFVTLNSSIDTPDSHITKRYGENYRVKIDPNKKPSTVKSNFANLELVDSNGDIFLTVGKYFFPDSRVVIPLPIFGAGALLVSFRSINTSYYDSNYFTLKVDSKKSFGLLDKPISFISKIDGFEMEYQKKKEFYYVGYIPSKNGLVAIYNFQYNRKGAYKTTLVKHIK